MARLPKHCIRITEQLNNIILVAVSNWKTELHHKMGNLIFQAKVELM